MVSLSYDLGRRFARVRPPAAGPAALADGGWPLLELGLYPHVVAHDRVTGRLLLVGAQDGFDEAQERVRAAIARWREPWPGPASGSQVRPTTWS